MVDLDIFLFNCDIVFFSDSSCWLHCEEAIRETEHHQNIQNNKCSKVLNTCCNQSRLLYI